MLARIALLGDIKADSSGISVGARLKTFLASMDAVIANLEGPIVTRAKPRQGKRTPLSSSPVIASLLDDLNVRAVTLANNHIMDFGEEGLQETISFLDSMGIAWVGVSDGRCHRSPVLRLPDIRIAVFAYAHREGPMCQGLGRGIGPYQLENFEILTHNIQREVREGFSVLVSYHGGEEFHKYPWPRRLGWAVAVAEAGADLVYGHHSHSIQPVYKLSSGSVVAPGLGNFYFQTRYQKRHYGTDEGVVLVFDTRDRNIGIVRVRADWDRRHVDLDETSPSLDYRELNVAEVCKGWALECRRRVVRGGLNIVPKPGDWWRNCARSVLFLARQASRRYRNLRDRDVIMSSVPILGSLYARRIFDQGASEFDF